MTTAHIISLDYESRGVAKIDGKTIFVHNALPQEIAHSIETLFFTALRENPANVLVQFTYGQRSPLHLPPEADIQAEKVNYAWLNFPPAHVWLYRCKRQES